MRASRYLLCFFCLWLFQFSFAQQPGVKPKIDSLKKVIETATSDTIKINAWREWDNLIYYEEPETDLKLNLQIADLCEKHLESGSLSKPLKKFYTNSAAYAYNNLGSIFQVKGEMKKSLRYMQKGLDMYLETGYQPGIANGYGNLGISYSIMGDNSKATEYLLKSLRVNEKLKDPMGIAACYNNLAIVYNKLGMKEEVLEYYEKALAIRIEQKDDKTIAAAYTNLADYYFENGDAEKAFQYLKTSESISVPINDIAGLSYTYHNLGSYYKKKKDFEKALGYFLMALKNREQIGDKRGLSSTYSLVADIYMQQGKIAEAEKMAHKSLELAKSADAVETIKDAADMLRTIYLRSGDYKKAYDMQGLYHKMQDSIDNEDSRRAAMRQNLEYDYQRKKISDSVDFAKKKEMQDLALAKEKAESREKDIELQNETFIRYALFGGILILIVFFYFLYNRFKIIRQQKLIIEERNRDIVDSINYAQRIQRSILPSVTKFDETFDEYFILYLPKDVVSGDFYWLETVHTTVKTELKDQVSVLAAVDCTGHGVPGALMSVVGNTLLNQTIKNPDINSPGEALDFLNRELPKNLKKQNSNDVVRDGMDVSMCAIDRKSGKLYFAGANNPLYHIRHQTLTEYKGDKQAISGADDLPKINFTNHVIPIEKGDTIYLFSDGYADQFGGDDTTALKSGGKKFKYKRLKELLLSISEKPLPEQQEILHRTFMTWKGEMEQTDDILILGVRI